MDNTLQKFIPMIYNVSDNYSDYYDFSSLDEVIKTLSDENTETDIDEATKLNYIKILRTIELAKSLSDSDNDYFAYNFRVFVLETHMSNETEAFNFKTLLDKAGFNVIMYESCPICKSEKDTNIDCNYWVLTNYKGIFEITESNWFFGNKSLEYDPNEASYSDANYGILLPNCTSDNYDEEACRDFFNNEKYATKFNSSPKTTDIRYFSSERTADIQKVMSVNC